jgi:glycosyltransferase involved in cell wall biosynthesis
VFNREVLDGAGRWFFSDAAEVAARMAEVEALDAAERARVGEVSRERVATVYTWERITAQYEALFREMAAG